MINKDPTHEYDTNLFQSASVWVPDICLIWVMLFCLSRRRAELLNTDMMLDSESITTGEFGGNCYYGNVAEDRKSMR